MKACKDRLISITLTDEYDGMEADPDVQTYLDKCEAAMNEPDVLDKVLSGSAMSMGFPDLINGDEQLLGIGSMTEWRFN